ncbi:hypothetical protein [Desulfuromonas sp. TF]|uniref:hypothetical protein n=1 Tax=Desulfuromonas sp. TF TaxID=1232410 RepID=UPI00048457B8|nr:hypothetical protein [Desulfuromonas sp. TF]
MFVSIEDARSRILCPIYGALYHFLTSGALPAWSPGIPSPPPGAQRPEPINGLELSPCCRADRCGFWRWRGENDRSATEERFEYLEADYPDQPDYLGAGTWSPEELAAEAEAESRYLRGIGALMEAWTPPVLEGWRIVATDYDEDEGRIYARYERERPAGNRFGFCGLAGRPGGPHG